MYHSLTRDIEKIPNWLREYKLGDKIDLREVLSHRVLFYPGAGTDGQPIKAFNMTHTVHTYLYSDYWMNLDDVRRIYNNDRVRGYMPYDIVTFPIDDLMPNTISADMCIEHKWNKEYPEKFCAMCIYERICEYDDSHGAERFALIYTNEDAYRVFNVTFHPKNSIPAPYAIVLQEHGFGGNYDRWGRDGLLEKIAIKYSIYPKYYIIGMNNTNPWHNSYPCHDGRMNGGCARWPRELFKHKELSIRDYLQENERDLLPIIRHPFQNWEQTEILLLPIVYSFLHSDNDKDEYHGWSFFLQMVKPKNTIEFDFIMDSIDIERQKSYEGWNYAPSKKNRRESVLYNSSVAILIHQESWLWFE